METQTATQTAISGRVSNLAQLARMAPSAQRDQQERDAGVLHSEIRIDKLVIKDQDRTNFTDVTEFAERLKIAGGVHTPILVRALGMGSYELVAGERRTRASKANGWSTIPAKIFPKDTPTFILRLYQVSENQDRRQLGVSEVAKGLARDIDTFGRDQAAQLWTNANGKERSQAWISKHLRWMKYGTITLALFNDGLFHDIEAANKLADIEQIDPQSADEFAQQMRAGVIVSRLTLEKRLSELRAPVTAPKASAKHSGASSESPGQAANGPANQAAVPQVPGPGAEATSPLKDTGSETLQQSAPETDQSGESDIQSKSSNTMSSLPSTTYRDGKREGASRHRVHDRMEEIYETYSSTISRMRQLRADLTQASVPTTESDWSLWLAFSGVTCALLIGAGQERATALLKRFTDELQSKSPLQLLNSLHPTAKAGVLPDDFRYDTGREMHPQPPTEWAL